MTQMNTVDSLQMNIFNAYIIPIVNQNKVHLFRSHLHFKYTVDYIYSTSSDTWWIDLT